MSKRYAIKEMFPTLQGEGFHAGRAAVFLRFAGCNLWSGHARDRERDAQRTGAHCPTFCDTDFVGGERLRVDEIVNRLRMFGASQRVPVVMTGGEPLLQLDVDLLEAVRQFANVHVETNGTVKPTDDVEMRLNWITMSPKLPADRLSLHCCHELKVVVPRYDPLSYCEKPAMEPGSAGGVVLTDYLYVQPEDGPFKLANTQACIKFVREHPEWRLSLQTHKVLEIP